MRHSWLRTDDSLQTERESFLYEYSEKTRGLVGCWPTESMGNKGIIIQRNCHLSCTWKSWQRRMRRYEDWLPSKKDALTRNGFRAAQSVASSLTEHELSLYYSKTISWREQTLSSLIKFLVKWTFITKIKLYIGQFHTFRMCHLTECDS